MRPHSVAARSVQEQHTSRGAKRTKRRAMIWSMRTGVSSEWPLTSWLLLNTANSWSWCHCRWSLLSSTRLTYSKSTGCSDTQTAGGTTTSTHLNTFRQMIGVLVYEKFRRASWCQAARGDERLMLSRALNHACKWKCSANVQQQGERARVHCCGHKNRCLSKHTRLDENFRCRPGTRK